MRYRIICNKIAHIFDGEFVFVLSFSSKRPFRFRGELSQSIHRFLVTSVPTMSIRLNANVRTFFGIFDFFPILFYSKSHSGTTPHISPQQRRTFWILFYYSLHFTLAKLLKFFFKRSSVLMLVYNLEVNLHICTRFRGLLEGASKICKI